MESEHHKALAFTDELSKAIEHKSLELKEKEQQLGDCDREICNLKS
jgi:hypothetical protein